MNLAYAAADLAACADGRWTAAPAGPVAGFGIDTRALRAGEMFVAVRTERRGGEEVMAVAALRAHGDEDLADAQGARVDAEARDGAGGRDGPAPVGPGGEVGGDVGAAHAETPLRSSRISRTT